MLSEVLAFEGMQAMACIEQLGCFWHAITTPLV
eukprot:COSAG01_NODE_23838_length_800_cov_0.639087_1_plen_32_part_01